MPVILTQNAYGKSKVRLTKVTRRPDRHDLVEWSVDIQLEGDFAAAYADGDNRLVVATDTMKNTVYALARDIDLASPENFALRLSEHFLAKYPQVSTAAIAIHEQAWQRIDVDGQPHPHAFIGSGPERRVCRVARTRSGPHLRAGIEGMIVLKTANSAFRNFHHDEFRTLPDTDDRIMATEVSAEWPYESTSVDGNACFDLIRRTLLKTFAEHKSLGVQHTLYAMGEAALAACSAIDEISLTMPNRHRLPINLAPFNRTNPNEIFVATDEPHGLISGTFRRQ